MFCVKGNQPNPYAALDEPPRGTVPVEHTEVVRGHGRTATRTISTLPAPSDLPFPHVNQVFLIERHVVDTAGKTLSHLGVLGVTSLAPGRADAAAIALHLAGRHDTTEATGWAARRPERPFQILGLSGSSVLGLV